MRKSLCPADEAGPKQSRGTEWHSRSRKPSGSVRNHRDEPGVNDRRVWAAKRRSQTHVLQRSFGVPQGAGITVGQTWQTEADKEATILLKGTDASFED